MTSARMSTHCDDRLKAFKAWKRLADGVPATLMTFSTQCEVGTEEDRIVLLDSVRQSVGNVLSSLESVIEACSPSKLGTCGLLLVFSTHCIVYLRCFRSLWSRFSVATAFLQYRGWLCDAGCPSCQAAAQNFTKQLIVMVS
jgi:hypothetical protein